MKKAFKVTSLAAVGAAVILVAASPASAGISGTGASGVQIQNLTSGAGTAAVSLYNQSGAAAIQLNTLSLAAEGAANVYLPTTSGVSSGSYAMVVSSDVNAAAIARTDWATSGGAAIYSSVAPGTDVIVPLVTRNFAGQASQISIQNTDTAAGASDVNIQLIGRGQSTADVTLSNESIAAGTSKSYNLAEAAFAGLPNNGSELGVATGWVGMARITSSKALVVQSFVDIVGTSAVGGFSGVPASSASTKAYCPLIRSNFFGDTGIVLINTEATAATATITFAADGGSPNKVNHTQDVTVGANSSLVVFQGQGGGSPLERGTEKDKGWYGVASVSSNTKLLAVVNDTLFTFGTFNIEKQSTYNCATDADAGNKFALPLVRQNHLEAQKLTTGIQILNIGPGSAQVSIAFKNYDGTSLTIGGQDALTIPEGGSGNFFQGNMTGAPTVPADLGGFGWFGSAVVSSTGGKIVILVNDFAFGAANVDSANYNAIKIN